MTSPEEVELGKLKLRHAHLQKFAMGALGFLIIALACLNTVLFAILIADDPPWDPLGDYPVQNVLSIGEEEIVVSGTKCNDAQQDIAVFGEWSWQRVVPPGFSVQVGSGSGTRSAASCDSFTFENPIPEEVREHDEPGVVWRITGTETPIDSHGAEGVPRRWETETFVLTPEEGS